MVATDNQINKTPKPEFQTSLDKILLALELDDLLAESFDETNPIRRQENQHKLKLVWDSREIDEKKLKPNTIAFLARHGNRFNTHSLVETILSSNNIFIGEIQAITHYLQEQDRPEEWINDILSHPFLIPVTDSELVLRTLIDVATGIKPKDFCSVAVTGTSGKTSTVQILGQLLNKCTNKDVMRIGTLGIQTEKNTWENSYPTMPDYIGFAAALKTAKESNINDLVFEATSHGLIERRMGVWKVNVGVFTNFSQDHLDFHRTMEAYRSCKGILFEQHIKKQGFIVLNTDDKEWLYFLRRSIPQNSHVLGYGSKQNFENFIMHTKHHSLSHSFLEIKDLKSTAKGIEGTWIFYEGDIKKASANYESSLLGEFQHFNLAAASATLLALGFKLADIATNVKHIYGIPGRLELATLEQQEGTQKNLPTVLIDYAHKPDALEKTLITLHNLKEKNGKLICVFGCGGDRDTSKRPIMGQIAEQLADVVIVTSDNPRSENPDTIIEQILSGFQSSSSAITLPNRKEAIFAAINMAKANDIVVIAGKGHENYQIIGDQKFDFSDLDVAKQALQKKL